MMPPGILARVRSVQFADAVDPISLAILLATHPDGVSVQLENRNV